MSYTNYPNLTRNLTDYITGLPSFPVDRTDRVRYGFSDSNKPVPWVQFNDASTLPDYWTTDGPTGYTSTFSISCFHRSQDEAYTLALAVNDLFAGQKITDKTMLCEPLSMSVVQEDEYKFHSMLTYRLQEAA